MMRLDKWISQSLDISRNQAKKLIAQGRVKVETAVVRNATLKVNSNTQIYCDNRVTSLPRTLYIALHKPAGYICSTQDESYPSVLNLIADLSLTDKQKSKLHFAGRLDVDTTGLVLISDDGQWTHAVTSPRKKQPKVYRVVTAEPIEPEQISQLEEGINLKGEQTKTLPAVIEKLNDKMILLTIIEGRYHQVKRMLAAVGNQVESLHREKIGSISLQQLAESEYRLLTKEDVDLF
jgi:16S rRNA pseudouridine516 synthase